MAEAPPIHDLYWRSIEPTQTEGLLRWPILRRSDHLLRCFALAEALQVSPQADPTMRRRALADEVWALLQGAVEFRWHDLRQDSPSQGVQFRLRRDEPTLLLVPFGVAFGFRALEGPALLVRLASHEHGEGPEDEIMPWQEQETA